MVEFAPLYKEIDGKIRFWVPTIEGNTYYTTYGFVDGKRIISKSTVVKGTNIGRANEKTPEQACIERVRKLWNDKKADGYVESLDEETKIFYKPMLAETYSSKTPLVYPVYVQPKLDGVRCIAYWNGEEVVMQSRRGKFFQGLVHIREELRPILVQGVILDGELYNHELQFNEISGKVRQQDYNGTDIKYYVYDIICEGPYADRYAMLDGYCEGMVHVRVVETRQVMTEKALNAYHASSIERFYEGTMIRIPSSEYQMGKRSKHLLKKKDFIDKEFRIVYIIDGNGSNAGLAKFILEYTDANGNLNYFDAGFKGTHEYRRELFNNKEQYIGKMLTVRYQETLYWGAPRFPVGVAIRDYE